MGPRIASVLADAGPDPSGPGIWRLGPRPRYSQRVPARAREKLGVRERGRTVETRPIPILSAPPRPPQLQGSLRCKAKGAFAQGTGRNSARKRKKKKKSRWTPAPASKPTEAAAPFHPRVALTHSPLLRLHRRRRDHNRSPLRAPPRARPDHAPGTPLCGPAPQPTDLPGSAGVSAGLRDLLPVCLWSRLWSQALN